MKSFDRLSHEPMPHIPAGTKMRVELRTARELEHERKEFKRDRYYRGGRARYMAHAGGYVMARKPRSTPFVVSEKEWRQLPFVG